MQTKIIDFSRYTSVKIGPALPVAVLESASEVADFVRAGGVVIGGGNNLLISPTPPPLAILGGGFDFIELARAGDLREKLGAEFSAKLGAECGEKTSPNSNLGAECGAKSRDFDADFDEIFGTGADGAGKNSANGANEALLRVGARTNAALLFNFAKKHGLGGFEFMRKIPGTIGGLVKMNAGVKDFCVARVLRGVRTERGWLAAAHCGLGYRKSAFDGVVLEAVFGAPRGDDGGGFGGENGANLNKKSGENGGESGKNSGANGANSNLAGAGALSGGRSGDGGGDGEKIAWSVAWSEPLERALTYVRANQPSGASFGSVFKNPAGDAAGRLIEAAELKGFVRGACAFSDKHANFLIHTPQKPAQPPTTPTAHTLEISPPHPTTTPQHPPLAQPKPTSAAQHPPLAQPAQTSAPTPASRADTRAPAVSNSNLSAERGDGSCVELGAERGGDLPAGAAAFFDAIWLIDEAKRRVFERFGVKLECEVVIL